MFDLVEMRREIELLFTVALYAFSCCSTGSTTRSATIDGQRNVQRREPQEGRWTQRSTASVRLCARHFRMMC